MWLDNFVWAPMSIEPPIVGISLICDPEGMIQQVISDGIGLSGLSSDQSLDQCVDSGSREKLQTFLSAVWNNGTAIEAAMDLSGEDQPQTLRLAGTRAEDRLMVVGTHTWQDALLLCGRLMDINRVPALNLRNAILSQFRLPAVHSEEDSPELYDEISRINNQLVTLQRELSRKNAELEGLYADAKNRAVTDSLTGLYNYRGVFDLGEREIARARRYGHSLSAIMFDIDKFKGVNDTFGHVAGNEVLQQIAKRCSSRLRSVDIFGRYGGDEFLLLLPQKDPSSSRIVAERMSQIVSEPIVLDQSPLTVTISIGIAQMDRDTKDLKELLERAAQALKKAKRLGRSRIVQANA